VHYFTIFSKTDRIKFRLLGDGIYEVVVCKHTKGGSEKVVE